jgi:hypothetical protein
VKKSENSLPLNKLAESMKKTVTIFLFSALILFAACKKGDNGDNSDNKPLYPLTAGNKWIYVDSFFNDTGYFYGLDTFTLIAAKTINFNNQIYTPVTDQYDDSIFTLRATDSTVFILKELGETLMFKWPFTQEQPVIVNTYHGDSLKSVIYTERITYTNYPSYKIVITQDDGTWWRYKQQELFFTSGIGIIKGRDLRKNRAGNIYAYDSYKLIAYSLN